MKVQLSEFSMAVEDRGAGLPVLFIHGYPLNNQIWQPQVEGLCDVARILAPDLRGHGDSEAAPGAYTMEAHAQDCHELLEKLEIHDKVVVCGLSMGGYIALAFYRLFPHRVAGMVLASTQAAADSPEARANRDKSIQLLQEKGIRPIATGMASKLLSAQSLAAQPHLEEKLINLMMHNSLIAVQGDLQGMKVRMDSTPWLESIQVPVLIIHGAEDAIVPMEKAIQMQERIPQARLCAIPAAAHLNNLEQPALFNDCMRSFLESF